MTVANSNTTQVLPEQRAPVIDRYRRWSPVWWRFMKPLLESVNRNSETLVAVSEDLTTAQAAITTEQTVRANEDEALAQQITTLNTTFSTDIAEVQASIVTEQTARSTADAALASQITTLSADVASANAATSARIGIEETARATADSALSSQLTTLSANLTAADTVLAASVSNETSARVSADGVLSAQISSLSATVTTADATLNARVDSEASARASGDGVNASAITALTTTVGNNSASISSLESSVNGIEAKYVLTVNVNGRITGIELAGNSTSTAMTVLADKFLVIHPSETGSPIQAFIVGSVNGTTTVGVNGNLIVDDTILARHLNVSSLSAIAANVGTVTAGVLQSSDGAMVIDLNNKSIVMTV